MISFVSKYSATVDGKGRIVLPAPFKRELGDSPEPVLVVEKDAYDACLNIYPYATWQSKVEEMRKKLNVNNPVHSKLLSHTDRISAPRRNAKTPLCGRSTDEEKRPPAAIQPRRYLWTWVVWRSTSTTYRPANRGR